MKYASKYAEWGPAEGISAAVQLQSRLYHNAFVRLSDAVKAALQKLASPNATR
jgi:hypothetical protein